MRFELQKTWDTKKRLQRWASNDFGKKGQAPDRTAQIEKERKEALQAHQELVKNTGTSIPPEAVKALKKLGIRMGERTKEMQEPKKKRSG